MPKKNLIEEALIEAQELERASIENAKDIVLESFTPDFVNFFRDVLNESEDNDEDDIGGDSDPDEDESEDDDEDDETMKEAEHDMGKYPDPGREGTDPALDDDEEQGKEYQSSMVDEGEYDAVSGDATPEKGQAGLPNKPKVKKVGDKGWEDEGTAGYAADDPEKSPGDMPGKKPSTKQTGKGGWEEEGSEQAATPAPREKLAGVPKPPVKVVEAEEADDEKEDLDVPEDLFDDEEDITEAVDKDDDVDLENVDDAEIDIDIEDDDDKDETNEGVDIEIEDDEDSEEEDDEDDEEEEVNENLYVRRGGRFKKITPAEYLTTRIDSLEEALSTAHEAVEVLQGQLQETHLFNAKLAHLNKLYMTGAFTNSEKERIAERLDECDDLSEVKSLYKTIISEVTDNNPLDDFSNLIKENRIKRNTKTESIYESADVSRMKRLMNYELDNG